MNPSNRDAPKLLPPPAGLCQFCATRHGPEDPHSLASHYYAMQFLGRFGRLPRAADAIAHCPPKKLVAFRWVLKRTGAWTDLDSGVDPIEQVPRFHHLRPATKT